jgi:hypothetical protein
MEEIGRSRSGVRVSFKFSRLSLVECLPELGGLLLIGLSATVIADRLFGLGADLVGVGLVGIELQGGIGILNGRLMLAQVVM